MRGVRGGVARRTGRFGISLRRVFASLLWLTLSAGAAAGPLALQDVPAPLQPWVAWALHGETGLGCPTLFDRAERRCAWPGALDLAVEADGGRFGQRWEVYARTPVRVPLPGDARHWPVEVEVDGRRAAVLDRGGRPVLELGPGTHQVRGAFVWKARPESLALPADLGLLALTRDGDVVEQPALRADGVLWLAGEQQGAAAADADRAGLRVYRRIVDDTPLQVETHIDLDVSGRQREILIGPVLLPGAVPMALESRLAARLEADGRLRVQVRPGRWQLRMTARFPGALTALPAAAVPAPWPDEEIWVFDARPQLRLVEVGGAAAVDVRQTGLPGDWQTLPAYRVTPGGGLTFKVLRRGDPDPNPDQLRLQRTLWLDFDGGGYTVRDAVVGSVTRSWRLEADPELQLGQVVLDGQPQVITRLPDDAGAGVEIRRGALNLVADSRYEGPATDIPAIGWRHDFQAVAATLHLPPGWQLFSAAGADNVPSTWLQRWTLLDIFLVLLAVITAQRLWGVAWGGLMLVMLALTWHEPGAPAGVWLSLLASVALLRVVPAGRLQRAVRGYGYLSLVALLFIAVPYAVSAVRTGLYPQLELPGVSPQQAASAPLSPPASPQGVARAPASSLDTASAKLAEERPPKGEAERFSHYVAQVDPEAVASTGPGLPVWSWRSVPLSWNGPVAADQRIELVLLSPGVNLLLDLARVALVALLALRVIGRPVGRLRMSGGLLPGLLAAICLAGPLLPAGRTAQAQTLPSGELLEELRTRLLAPPDCLPACAQVPRLHLDVRDDRLLLRMEVEVRERTAIPLPAQPGQWLPSSVLVDDRPAAGLFRTPNGELWVGLEAGVHELLLSGSTAQRAAIQLPLPLRPHRVTVAAQGWSVAGIDPSGLVQGGLQLTRLADDPQAGALEPRTLPGFARVERTLRLGTEWMVETHVRRLSPPGSALTLVVPLLAGEAVVSDGVVVKDGAVHIALGPNAAQTGWQSILDRRERIELRAAETSHWVEQWAADVSPLWHVAAAGIPVTHHQDRNANWFPTWRPWPGETVTLTVTRPEGIGGQTLTIDRSHLQVVPGRRATEAQLSLTVRSSQGSQHTIGLPDEAELTGVSIDGIDQPIRLEAGRLVLPVAPREQTVEIAWRQAAGIGAHFRTPAIDLGAPSVNAHLQATLGDDRWILFTAGPQLGPAVLFWGVLVVVALLAAMLGRLQLTPLRSRHWLLLGIGLSQSPMLPAAVVVGWLFLLGARGRWAQRFDNARLFNALQLAIGVATLLALASLFAAVEQGLLGRPDMQIAGNFSYGNTLNWYQDSAVAAYPQGRVVSVPLLVYRLLMLAWALWLAFALLGWLRWGWQCLSADGLWRVTAKRAKPGTGAGAAGGADSARR